MDPFGHFCPSQLELLFLRSFFMLEEHSCWFGHLLMLIFDKTRNTCLGDSAFNSHESISFNIFPNATTDLSITYRAWYQHATEWFRWHWRGRHHLAWVCYPGRTSSNPTQSGSCNACTGYNAPAETWCCSLSFSVWSCKIPVAQKAAATVKIAITLVTVSSKMTHFQFFHSGWQRLQNLQSHLFQ